MEYSTISMLDYFEDTLANVGLPEAWMGWYSNGVTRIGKKIVNSESNRIENKLGQIESKTVSRIKSKTTSQIKSDAVSRINSDMMSQIKS